MYHLKVMYTQFLLTNLTCDINQINQKHILSMVHLKIDHCKLRNCFITVRYVLFGLDIQCLT